LGLPARRALSDAFAPPALAVVRPEVEHLLVDYFDGLALAR
jgi:cytochrome P450